MNEDTLVPTPDPTIPNGALGRIYLLILLSTMFWGGTAVAGKLAIRDLPPLTIGVFRYGLAAAVLAALCWRSLPAVRSLRRSDLRLLLAMGLLGACVNHVFFFVGLVFAPAAHAAIIAPTTSPIWTLLLAARLGQERVTRRQVAGVILCMAGVVLVIRPEKLVTGAGRMTLVGDLLFLLTGVSWGVYSYFVKVAMGRLSAVAALVLTMGIGTACLIPLALAERPWSAIAAAHPAAFAALAYLAFASTLFAFWGWNVTIRRLGAGRTSAFSNLVPVFGVLLSWLVLGERLAGVQLVGGGLAVCGVVLCQDPLAHAPAARPAPLPAAPPAVHPGIGPGEPG